MQYITRGFGGLPAFRRLVGRPILQDVRMQDVVFAEGRGACTSPHAAAIRTNVNNLMILDDFGAREDEKQDLRCVREGIVKMVQSGAIPELEKLIPFFAPTPLKDLPKCRSDFGMFKFSLTLSFVQMYDTCMFIHRFS